MSKWYDPIDINVDGEEINILIDQNDEGNVYVSAKVEDILIAIDNSRNKEVYDPLEKFT